MEKPGIDDSNKIFLKDFEKLFNSIPAALTKFSHSQIRQVFLHYADPMQTITVRVFKELFYPTPQIMRSKGDQALLDDSSLKPASDIHSEDVTTIKSMAIDNIMMGRKQEDVDREREAKERADIALEMKAKQNAPKMGPIIETREDFYDGKSDMTVPSRQMDDIIGGAGHDPRKTRFDHMKSLDRSGGLNKSALSMTNLQNLPSQQNVSLTARVDGKLTPIDRLIDTMFHNFCRKLVDEVKDSPAGLSLQSYVTRYGKTHPNYLTFSEFKEIYMVHVYDPSVDAKKSFGRDVSEPAVDPTLEAKVKAIFQIFDVSGLGASIPGATFAKIVLQNQPANTVIERMQKKIKKGGERFLAVLREEFQEADMPFGSQGALPIANLQNILLDYDIVMMAEDQKHLEDLGLVTTDDEKNKFVYYKQLLEQAKPKPARKMVDVDACVVKIQKLYRGYKARKSVKEGRSIDLKGVGHQYGAIQGRRTM